VERLWEECRLAAGHRLDPPVGPVQAREVEKAYVALDELRSAGSERDDRPSLVDTLEDKGAEDPWRSTSPRR
jgi:hypothetical protein